MHRAYGQPVVKAASPAPAMAVVWAADNSTQPIGGAARGGEACRLSYLRKLWRHHGQVARHGGTDATRSARGAESLVQEIRQMDANCQTAMIRKMVAAGCACFARSTNS